MGSKLQSKQTPRNLLVFFALIPLLAACESTQNYSIRHKPLHDGGGTKEAMFTAALSPLEDLGLRKRDIPAMLTELVENPYAVPKEIKCDGVKEELDKITFLIGPDFDAASTKTALSFQQKVVETGGDLAHDAIVGAVRSQVSFLPFRGILRRITGASSHEKAVARALEAGKLRRAYLRGLADAKFGIQCPVGRIISVSAEPVEEGLEIAAK